MPSRDRKGNCLMANTPRNRLDAAVDSLEEQLEERIKNPLRRLRKAIASARERGKLTPEKESKVIRDIEHIRTRDKLSAKAQHLQAADEIDHLAKRLLEEDL